MPRELKAVIRYGIRQTPSRAVLDKPLAFSAVKSNTSAGKPESATLDSMSGIIRVDFWSGFEKGKEGEKDR